MLGAEPAQSLQIVSATLGCWMLFPLVSLWSGIVGRRLGIAAAVLFLFLPGPWLLAGRAYSGTAATSFLVAGLAFWLGWSQNRWSAFLGGVFSGMAILTRPHVLPVVLIGLLFVRKTNSTRPRFEAGVALAATLAVGTTVLALASSGVEPLLQALTNHWQYHFGALPNASSAFAESGLVRCLIHPVAAGAWILLVLGGIWLTTRAQTTRSSAVTIALCLFAMLAVVWGVSDPAHARYFVPILALSSGFVVAALARGGRSIVYAGVAAATIVSTAVVFPNLPEYRSATSPAIAALQTATMAEGSGPPILVVDHTLISFVGLLKATQRVSPSVIYDNQIESGRIPAPPPNYSVAVFASKNSRLIEMESRRQTYACSVPILYTLERRRYLNVVTSSKPVLKGWVDDGKPYILIDGD